MSARSGSAAGRIGNARLGARQHLRAAEMVGDGDQAARREDRHLAARPGRLRPAGRRADQAAAAGHWRAIAAGSAPGHRRDRAVERQFAEHDEVAELVAGHGAERRHQAERDRQIVVAALLGQVGRREVDDDPLVRQRQAARVQRRRTRSRLSATALSGRPTMPMYSARRDVHLHVDRHRLDALKRNRRDVCHHRAHPNVPMHASASAGGDQEQ